MELEFGERQRRRLLLVVGLVLALVAGAAAFFLGSNSSTTAQPAATRQVVVAAVTIPARTIIDSTHLTVRTVPDDKSVFLAVREPSEVLGLVTAVTVYADQLITPNLLATTAVGQEFSILGPTETVSPYSPVWRAVSVLVARERAVGGAVQPGQRIDLIATVPIEIKVEDEDGQQVEGTTPEGYYSDSSTKVTLTDIEVLSRDPENAVYVLKVDLHQAEELAALQASAQFTMALRPQTDNRIIDRANYGETLNRVVEQYIYPLPRIIQVDRYRQPEGEVVPEGSPTVAWPDPEPSPSPIASAPVASATPSGAPAESPSPTS